MRLGDLAIVILQQIGPVAMQHAGPAARQGGGVGAAVEAVACRLDANDLDAFIVQEGGTNPCVGAAAMQQLRCRVGAPALEFFHCQRSSSPMTDWKSRTMAG